MQYNPKEYQTIATDFLTTHKRCALFLDMGLGKTVVTLTHVKNLIQDFAINKALVVAPKRVAEDTWTREADKWEHLAGLRVIKVLGSAEQRKKALGTEGDVYVINRENLVWLIETLDGKWPFECLIVDELSSFKSAKSKRFRMLRRIVGQCDYIIGLTGTPAPNGYIDLFSEMFVIDQGETLGKTLTAYRSEYFSPGAHKGNVVFEWKLKPYAKEKIDRKLAKSCLSMSKEDWLKLPPIIYNDIIVRMSKSERHLYDTLKTDKVLPMIQGELGEITNMDSAIVGSTAAVLSGKLLQMANGCVYDEDGQVVHIHDNKLDALENLVEESQGQPILLFYSYQHDVDRILAKFPQAVKLKDSSTIQAWNSGDIPLLLCHPASAGHGLNLQDGGHIICWFGLPWSLELYQQACARLYRQGQEQSVIVHHIVCEGTLDEKVLRVLGDKNATQKGLLDALKGYLE